VKLRHPVSGAIYETRQDGLVRVSEGARTGLFTPEGEHVRGEIRDADPHFVAWVGGPTLASRTAPPPRRRAAPPARRTDRRRKGVDLGLEGRRALVTAASRGIGLAIARELASEGAHVAICARGEAGLETARKELEAFGVTVFARCVDVGDGDALMAFVDEAAAALGGLDILVSNASAGAGQGEESWRANFEVDVLGASRCVQAGTPHLQESDAASVVFISSTAALEYLGVPQPYNAMKAALIAHANDLSQALAPRGIRVNAVSPGPIYFEGGNWEMIEQTMKPVFDATLAQCPQGRMGTPEEVARAVAFLASPAASLVTGANLVADGGFTKRVAY
jgi:NAD(P)-dependent dehydrogenase (short-subunit alcohol dehydrogenase family)